MAIPPHHGAKIGTRIAMLVSRAIISTHQALLGTKHKLAMVVFNAISDEISTEVHESMGPLLRHFLDNLPDDSHAKSPVSFMATKHGQLQAGAGIGMLSGALLSSIGTVLNNELAPVIYSAVRSNPHLIPDPNTVATLGAKGVLKTGAAIEAIAEDGFNSGWGNALIDAARSYPSSADAIQMFQRGLITTQQFVTSLERNGVPPEYTLKYFELAHVPLSPADAALAVLRGNMSMADAQKAANDWGVDNSDFGILIGNTGEPLALEQLLESYRRGFIDKAKLERGIRQSRVRDEWIPTAEKLRYAPMSVADAVNATVQNHISHAEGNSIAELNGLQPGQFDILYQTAGEPLSRGEMESLYNRGIVTEADVKQALRESRVKDKYIDDAFALHKRIIEPRQLATALEQGAITNAEASKYAMDYGYDATETRVIVESGIRRKLRTFMDRVVTSTITQYEDNLISPGTARTIVEAMGYHGTEADFILQAGEFRRTARLTESAVTVLRSKYLARHITKQQLSGSLDALGVPADRRDQMITLWTIDRTANTKVLTPAQIAKAVKLSIITPEDGRARLEYEGYSAGDAELFLLIEGA